MFPTRMIKEASVNLSALIVMSSFRCSGYDEVFDVDVLLTFCRCIYTRFHSSLRPIFPHGILTCHNSFQRYLKALSGHTTFTKRNPPQNAMSVEMVKYMRCCFCSHDTMILQKPDTCDHCNHKQCEDCDEWLDPERTEYWLEGRGSR